MAEYATPMNQGRTCMLYGLVGTAVEDWLCFSASIMLMRSLSFRPCDPLALEHSEDDLSAGATAFGMRTTEPIANRQQRCEMEENRTALWGLKRWTAAPDHVAAFLMSA